jgi:hypothetical protein
MHPALQALPRDSSDAYSNHPRFRAHHHVARVHSGESFDLRSALRYARNGVTAMTTRYPTVEPAESRRPMVEPDMDLMPRLAAFTDESSGANPRDVRDARDAYEAYLMACRILTAMRRDLSRRR